ncbi:MAG TPA: TfoX/Sxy family DNA transformation protein [Devosia sp.]|nr:TfoX/Sxy family DNA transformation protein [Devosia sp.]
MSAIESAPNIGKVLGRRLRAVGIDSREALDGLGEDAVFSRLIEKFPEDACAHTRRAIAGAVRGIRHWDLDAATVAQIQKDYPATR